MEAAGTPAAKLTLMLIYTGMRIGEMFSLPLSGYHESYVIGGEKQKRAEIESYRSAQRGVPTLQRSQLEHPVIF